jgi:hypothetical protein
MRTSAGNSRRIGVVAVVTDSDVVDGVPSSPIAVCPKTLRRSLKRGYEVYIRGRLPDSRSASAWSMSIVVTRGLDGQTPASVFTAIEADAMIPLPQRQFQSVVYTIGRVAPDCHVKAFYSGVVAADGPTSQRAHRW